MNGSRSEIFPTLRAPVFTDVSRFFDLVHVREYVYEGGLLGAIIIFGGSQFASIAVLVGRKLTDRGPPEQVENIALSSLMYCYNKANKLTYLGNSFRPQESCTLDGMNMQPESSQLMRKYHHKDVFR